MAAKFKKTTRLDDDFQAALREVVEQVRADQSLDAAQASALIFRRLATRRQTSGRTVVPVSANDWVAAQQILARCPDPSKTTDEHWRIPTAVIRRYFGRAPQAARLLIKMVNEGMDEAFGVQVPAPAPAPSKEFKDWAAEAGNPPAAEPAPRVRPAPIPPPPAHKRKYTPEQIEATKLRLVKAREVRQANLAKAREENAAANR